MVQVSRQNLSFLLDALKEFNNCLFALHQVKLHVGVGWVKMVGIKFQQLLIQKLAAQSSVKLLRNYPHVLLVERCHKKICFWVAEINKQYFVSLLHIFTKLVSLCVTVIHRNGNLLIHKLGGVLIVELFFANFHCVHQGQSFVLGKVRRDSNDKVFVWKVVCMGDNLLHFS